jgi:hypothetical protein
LPWRWRHYVSLKCLENLYQTMKRNIQKIVHFSQHRRNHISH